MNQENITSGKLTSTDRRTIEGFIGCGRKDFQLLYSFSQHGANTSTFHSNCNNKGPTVTVIFDNAESVYGGYTSQNWSGSGTYCYDNDAFLFRLRFKGTEFNNKFPVKSPTKAIYCNSSYGPTFGGGQDLYTFSGTLTNSHGYYTLNGGVAFGHSYDMVGVSANEITGNNRNVNDLEVYAVVSMPGDAKTTKKDVGTDAPQFSDSPWREIGEWDLEHLEKLKKEIEGYCVPQELKANCSRILFLGPVGAGKSSFINTVASIFRGHISSQAVCGSAEHSITSKFQMHAIRCSPTSQPMRFLLCDTRGIEENQGMDGTELHYLLEGNVPDGFQFNPSSPIYPDIQGFVTCPTLNEKIHCVCFVIDASTATVLSEKLLEKIKALQLKVRLKGVPQVILLTKVDKACYQVEESAAATFKSETVRNLVDKVCDVFGVSRNLVLPVKNYEKEVDVKTDISILALVALRQVLRAAEDYLFNFLSKLEQDNLKDKEV